jgi:hypothetical protein
MKVDREHIHTLAAEATQRICGGQQPEEVVQVIEQTVLKALLNPNPKDTEEVSV